MLPFVLVFMLLLINKKELMGEYTNSHLVQCGGVVDHSIVIVLIRRLWCTLRWGRKDWRLNCLKEFSRRQILHQCQVGFQKVERSEAPERDPLHIPEYPIFDFSPIFPHFEESQFHHAAVWVLVLDPGDFFADNGQIPSSSSSSRRRASRGCSPLRFFLRETPISAAWFVSRTLAHQKLPVLNDEPATTRFMTGKPDSPIAVRLPRIDTTGECEGKSGDASRTTELKFVRPKS